MSRQSKPGKFGTKLIIHRVSMFSEARWIGKIHGLPYPSSSDVSKKKYNKPITSNSWCVRKQKVQISPYIPISSDFVFSLKLVPKAKSTFPLTSPNRPCSTSWSALAWKPRKTSDLARGGKAVGCFLFIAEFMLHQESWVIQNNRDFISKLNYISSIAAGWMHQEQCFFGRAKNKHTAKFV